MTVAKRKSGKVSQQSASHTSMSVTKAVRDRTIGPSAQEPAEVLRSILDDPTVTVAEKINAAKALDAIQKRGADRHGGRASRMSRVELQEAIAQLRSLMAAQGIDKSGKASP